MDLQQLDWRKQVLEQCSKANKLLGFVKRSTRNITCQSARRTLYLTLVKISSRLCNASLVTTVRRAHLSIRTSTKACFKIHPWPAFSLRSQLYEQRYEKPIPHEEMLLHYCSDIPTVVYNQINKDMEYFTKTHN